MSSLLEGVIKKCPQWMLDLLPDDLVKAIKGEVHEPTTSGRKTAIDEDNINDVAYFMRNPKGRKEPLDDFIKGTKSKPYKYAVDNRKWKSITYLCGARQPQFYLNVFSNKIDDAPKWYKYFYVMVSNAKYKITHIPPEYYWTLIYECPLPIACLRMLLRDYQTTYKAGFTTKRVNATKEKDEEVFNTLPDDKTKIELVKYIVQDQINMDIDDVVQKDGNLTCISMLYGYYNLCYFVMKSSTIDKFKAFVDENRSTFDYLGECHIIMPQFKTLYEYAYSKAKRIPKSFDDSDKKSYLHEHAEKLAKNGCYNELKFMLNFGYNMSYDCEKACFGTLNRNMISLVDDQVSAVGWYLHNDFSKGQKIVQMGYYPSVKSISNFYRNEEIDSKTRNFDIIKYANPKDKLDALKYAIGNYHPELASDFIAKFSDRFENNSPESWDLKYFTTYSAYTKMCEILGIDEERFAKDLFKEAMHSMVYAIGKEKRRMYRSLVMKLFKFDPDCDDKEYIEFAIEEDDLKLAAELVRHGASPDCVRKWKKKASYEMYKVITENL